METSNLDPVLPLMKKQTFFVPGALPAQKTFSPIKSFIKGAWFALALLFFCSPVFARGMPESSWWTLEGGTASWSSLSHWDTYSDLHQPLGAVLPLEDTDVYLDRPGVAEVGEGVTASVNLIYVGDSGTGALAITGGLVNSSSFRIGHEGGSNGTVTVTSGTWQNPSDCYVGIFGRGTLTISGGLVSTVWLSLGNGSQAAIGTTNVTGGTLSASAIFVGAVGTGSLNLSGSGVVSIAGSSGTLTLANNAGSVGTLNLGTGSNDTAGTLHAAVVNGGSGAAVVNFNHAGDTTFGSILAGSLSVNQLNGTTLLTATNTYTGTTTVAGGELVINGFKAGTGETFVNGGELVVNGTNAGNVTVSGNGLLGGSGVIGGSVANSGFVNPGNSPGTLVVVGNYTQGATGTLLMQIASSTVYDKLVVGGRATLGGTLQAQFLNGYTATVGESYTLITAAGGISGTFSTIKTNTVMTLQITYLAETALGVATVVQGLFADVDGLTPNQLAVARGLDKIVDHSRVSGLVGYLDGLDQTAIPQKLERIVPTDLLSMFDASIASSQVQASNLERRMGELHNGATGCSANGLSLSDSHGTRSFSADGKQAIAANGKELEPAPINERWGFFVNGSGEFVDEKSTSLACGTDFNTGGITTGADYRLGKNAAVGVTAGYANTSTDGRGDGTVNIDSGKLGLYGTYFEDGFFLNSALGGGFNSYDTKRDTLGGMARGDTGGTDFNTLLGSGYTCNTGAFSFGPIASMRYSWVGIDGFTERGSLAPLRVGEQSEDSLRSTAGLQLSYAAQIGATAVTPQIRAQWKHEYLDATRGIGASFLPGGDFTVYGVKQGRDSLLLDVGTTVQLTQTVGVYVYYTGDLGGTNSISNAVNGGVQMSF